MEGTSWIVISRSEFKEILVTPTSGVHPLIPDYMNPGYLDMRQTAAEIACRAFCSDALSLLCHLISEQNRIRSRQTDLFVCAPADGVG